MSKQLPAKEKDTTIDNLNGIKGGVNQNSIVIASFFVVIAVLIITNILNFALVQSLRAELTKLKAGEEQVEEGMGEETPIDEKGILFDLGDFVLNLADANPSKYLKVNVAIEFSRTPDEIAAMNAPQKKGGGGHGGGHGAAAPSPQDAIVAEMEQYKPAIRDAVISVLSSKTSDEVSSATGKEVAKEEIQELVNSVFNGSREVLRVSFGQFIIQ